MELGARLRQLAQTQQGLVSLHQARQMGASYAAVRNLTSSREWTAISPRVLALVGVPRTQLQLAMAAVLDAGPGAVASHHLAAALWDLPGFDLRRLHVSRPRSLRRPDRGLAVLHLPGDLASEHATVRMGVPVTTVARTVFDLAGTVHPKRLSMLVDRVGTQSPATLQRLQQLFDELARPGKPGVAVLRSVLDSRPEGYIPPESNLERRFMDILASAGEPPMRRQVNLGGDEWIGRIDFVDDPPLVLAEIDSTTYHSSVTDRAADAARDEALRRAGFTEIVRITEDQVWHHPGEVVELIRAARRRARGTAVREQLDQKVNRTLRRFSTPEGPNPSQARRGPAGRNPGGPARLVG